MVVENKIPELNLKVETKTIKGGEVIKLTVRNVFYVGIIGKIKTIYYWLTTSRDKTLKEYLNEPVKYERVLPKDINSFHSIDAEEELTKILIKELEDD